MDKPSPDNLGKRQHELNNRVNEAFIKKAKFEELKDEKENNEFDKFFKIDLAAKCRNIDYIIDVLKAGVTLYAHRALKKCQWLYDDEYSNIINPDYLHENVFRTTSMRVTRLILKRVVIKVRREDRAIAFFEYCMKMKMTDLALNCVLFTSDEFKLDLLQNNRPPFNNIKHLKHSYIRFIIGKSFDLLEAYLKIQTSDHDSIIRKFRYMYSVDNSKYLNLFDIFVKLDKNCMHTTKFDLKLCDDVMKKYKYRVLAKPIFYMNKIHEDILIRNITGEEAKIFLVTLLPESAYEFWYCWFLQQHNKFLKLIPRNEIFGFLKQIFNEKYPGEEFEMNKSFYDQCYYDFLTEEQQEEWALNQIKSDKQILGVGNDYLWYQFVNFKVAFEEIKNFVIVTKEVEKRADMLCTLVKAVRNDRDIEKLCIHYNKRHVNEPETQKRLFFDTLITHQRVFDFDETCWEAFYALLLSSELYNKDSNRRTEYPLEYYKTVALMYHIVNEKELPNELIDFLIEDFYPRTDTYNSNSMTIDKLLGKLNHDKQRFLFNYLHQFYTNKINEYKYQPYTRAGRTKAQRYFSVIVKLMYVFNVYQETPKKVLKPQKQRKTRSVNTNLSDKQLLRELKKDQNLVVGKIPKLKQHLKNNRPIEINNFLKKIKIYFPNDITNSFLTMFKDVMSNELDTKLEAKSLETCVNGIFELGNENDKLNIMKKYVPKNAKIDFHEIEKQKLDIQRAVCRFAAKSLPPVPLNDMITYMQGDYVRYCLHIFSVYIAALPMSKSIELVESMLDTPVSTQKHALRLAYQCFSPDSLENISKEIWCKTKNVSLRSVIYKALYKRIVDKKESDLYDILISFTLDLHDDDEKEVFALLEKDTLPNEFLGKYTKAMWQAISQFKDKEPNIGRKTQVLNSIPYNFNVIDEEFIRTIINEHIKAMFGDKKLYLTYSNEDIANLFMAKSELIVYFIVAYSADEDLDNRKYIVLAQDLIKECLKLWNETHSGKHVYRRWCWEFIEHLNKVSLEYNTCSEYLIPVYEGIIDVLQEALSLHEIYTKKWEMELVISNRRALKKHRKDFGKDGKIEVVSETAREFGREIGTVVSEYVEKKIFYRSFSEKMNNTIIKCVREMLKIIFSATNTNYDEYLNNALIFLAAGLLEFETLETYMLALQLLPIDCAECSNDKYQMVIDTIQTFSHPEMQYAIYQKLQKYY